LNRSFEIVGAIPTTNPSSNIVVDDDYIDNYFVAGTDLASLVDYTIPLVIYKLDNEFVLGKEGLETKSTIAGTMGVVARWSDYYQKYEQGFINTTDVIYQKTNYSTLQVQWISGESVTASLAGYDYIVFGVNDLEENYLGNLKTEIIQKNKDFFNSVVDDYQFLLSGSLNSGAFKVMNDVGLDPTQNPSLSLAGGLPPGYSIPLSNEQRADVLDVLSGGSYGFTSSATYSYFAFEVEQNVKDEFLARLVNLFAYSDNFADRPIYLDMYLDHDTVLDKINMYGMPSLSERDKKVLESENI
jgi:hypothetical protein